MPKSQTIVQFSRSKKLFFALICAALALAIIEGTLRIAGLHTNQPQIAKDRATRWYHWGMITDPTLPWSWIPEPGATRMITVPQYAYKFRVSFNNQGFRGEDFAPAKEKGKIRVICIGDSCTMGWGVGDSRSYPFLLEKFLKEKVSDRVQVINAGVMAYTSFQGIHQMETRTLKLRPDIIIISFNWNDHQSAIDITESRFGRGVALSDKELPRLTLASRLKTVFSHLAIFQLMDRVIPHRANSNPAPKQGSADDVARVGPEDYKQNLREMIHLAQSHDALPVLLTEPCNPVSANDGHGERKKKQLIYI